jgi:hypothetical protein
MGWNGGKYYTRSRRVNGKVTREYLGKGELALMAAEADAALRQRRQQERDELRRLEAADRALDAMLDELFEWNLLRAQAALQAAGYHQHARGKWRRQRGQINSNG